ncbi:MAG: DUF805 domain-containing protein [Propylenella sp.]
MPSFHAAPRRSPLLWLLFGFKGRISRSIYWPSMLALIALNFALYFQIVGMTEEELRGSLPFVTLLLALAALYINLAVAVKRLHDVGYAGFLAVAVIIPFLNIAFSIWVGILPGTAGPNTYGDAADVPPQ